jgi:hypothetical protein
MSVDEDTLDHIEVEHFDGDEAKMQEMLEKLMEGTQQAAKRHANFIEIHWAVYILAFTIIIGGAGLFGYKLYRSLKDKESKLAEKKKLKEMKKKK